MRYAWIKQHRDSFPIRTMCRVLNVSTSGFYDWLEAKPSQRALRSKSIKAHVLDVYKSSQGIYGSAKIAQEMWNSPEREAGVAKDLYGRLHRWRNASWWLALPCGCGLSRRASDSQVATKPQGPRSRQNRGSCRRHYVSRRVSSSHKLSSILFVAIACL